MTNPIDLRLTSVWHGADTPDQAAEISLHFTLFNAGTTTVTSPRLNMSGGFWLLPEATAGGATILRRHSNYTALDLGADLAPGEARSFSLAGLYGAPHRAGDGPASAYVEDRTGQLWQVAVQKLGRSRDHRALHEAGPAVARASLSAPGPTIALVPLANLVSLSVAPLEAGPVLDITQLTPAERDLALEVEGLYARITSDTAPIFTSDPCPSSRRLTLQRDKEGRLGPGFYRLQFERQLLVLEHGDEAGLRHALISLAQMVAGARKDPDHFAFPVGGVLSDRPRFGWRGLHLDVARSFYPVAEIVALIDLMAWLKLNVLHLHLNDDEAWRIDVEGYPEIAEKAAWRGHGLPIPPLLGSGPQPYGGIYSAADIATMEAAAARWGISLLPEIDIPGHGDAAMTAVPALRDSQDAGGYSSIQGFHANALSPVLPQTQDFIAAAFQTVLKQFNGPAVHIGGDEVAAHAWSGSAAAREMSQAITGGPYDSRPLQARLIDPVHDLLTKAGKRTIAWEDAIHSSHLDPASTTAMVWQHVEQAQNLALAGYDVVLSPGNAYYLDMAYSENWDSVGGHWAGVVPLKKTYEFEAGLGWPAAALKRLAGVHACIWGESMVDRRNFDDLVFPRLYAFSERAWIETENKDFKGFQLRIQALPDRLARPEPAQALS